MSAQATNIREATVQDADALVPLLAQLGYPADAATVSQRLARLHSLGTVDRVYVAERAGQLVGLMTLHATPVLHRAGDVGRITGLVVDARERGAGVGRALVRHAEAVLRDAGCVRVEVTSGPSRTEAHAFYLAVGFANQGPRFAKPLDGKPMQHR